MSKIDPNFPFDIFTFIHRPLRIEDLKNDNFLERYLQGGQAWWEGMHDKIMGIQNMNNPEKIRADLLQHLKDIVGLTRDLRNITDNLTEDDLRKVILLAVPLWRKKGLEVGFKDIIKLFTGFNTRVFNWFDYRMIIGEKAIGEEQLGEDAWLISEPGVVAQETLGEAKLIIQFEEMDLHDGSEYGNVVIPYGDYSFQIGGAFSSSEYYLRGNNFFIIVQNKEIYDFTQNWTIEMYIRNGLSQEIPLFIKWKDGRGIKIIANAITDEITYVVSDGITTQSGTFAAGVDLSDITSFNHIAWVVDWSSETSGEFSIWVDGTQIAKDDMSGALLKAGINNHADIFIGAESLGGGIDCGFDAIRVTNDVRYSVDLATITPPGTNFVEYQEEQLDEFQMDIRVVDDGNLDRTMLKRIINLMRPASERLNILYIDFYDEFVSGKGQWNTITGTAYVEETDAIFYMKLPEDSFEVVEVTGASDWKNYIAQQRCTIYDGTELEIRFLVQDENNYYGFRINTELKLAYFEKTVGGVVTSLASPKEIDVSAVTPPTYLPYYVYMISSFKNEATGITTLRAMIDSNVIFEVDDNSFEKGTFGLYAPIGSTVWCSEAEMFQMPLEYDRINPNDEF